MSSRVEIKNAVIQILEESDLFYKVYPEPTNIEKERSFPVAWVNLGHENIYSGEMTKTNYIRSITLEITIGSKHNSLHDTTMDELVDNVFTLLKSNFTLNKTAINLTPTNIITDEGYYHPYSFVALTFIVQMR